MESHRPRSTPSTPIDEAALITEILPTDILMGRGVGMHAHEGNVRFRERVAARKAEYVNARRTEVKQSIAMEVLDETVKQDGRFLCKVAPAAWVLADQAVILEKVKQALREGTRSDSTKATANKASTELLFHETMYFSRASMSQGTRVPPLSIHASNRNPYFEQLLADEQLLSALILQQERERQLVSLQRRIAFGRYSRSVALVGAILGATDATETDHRSRATLGFLTGAATGTRPTGVGETAQFAGHSWILPMACDDLPGQLRLNAHVAPVAPKKRKLSHMYL